MKDWHIRMTITSYCNYECIYCSKSHPLIFLDKSEIVGILKAAYDAGIKRVHWTGGEPSCHPDFFECVSAAQKIGYEEQVVSTNGSYVHFDKMCELPINRFNISLDTLKEPLYSTLTNRNNLNQVLNNVSKAIEANKLVKINCVVMKNNIDEIPAMINYFSQFNTETKDNIILRLIQFYPSNPNQLDMEGRDYWACQYIKYDEILDRIGRCKAVQTIGDNPTFQYFELFDYPLKVGILAMFSWDYICGDCLKLRVTPFGEASICLSDENTFQLKGLSIENKTEVIQNAMKRRESFGSKSRKHFNPYLGMFRFGSDGKKVTLSDLNRNYRDLENGNIIN